MKSKLIIAAALASLLISCSKTEKNKLEFSFDSVLEETDAAQLQTLIGTDSGSNETFGEKASILVYFGDKDCSTCAKVLPNVESWVKKTRCKVYAYYESPETDEIDRKNILKKLGSSNGTELTAGRLIAFSNGKRVGSINGIYDLESDDKIDKFVKQHFSYLKAEEIITGKTKSIETVSELFAINTTNEPALIYFERKTCPDCRILSNPQKNNTIEYLLKNFSGTIYKATTEKILKDLLDQNIFEKIKNSNIDDKMWPTDESSKKKTETIELIAALGYLKDLNQLNEYAELDEKPFIYSDRNVPSFVYVGSSSNSCEKIHLLNEIYELTGQKKDNAELHRSNIPNYFSADNTQIEPDVYQKYLKEWLDMM